MGVGWLAVARVLVGSALVLACSAPRQPSSRDVADANDTGQALSATNAAEREVIRRLPLMRDGVEIQVAELGVVADAPYAAASGRICRALHLTTRASGKVQHRLACSDGRGWFFVPDVLGLENAAE